MALPPLQGLPALRGVRGLTAYYLAATCARSGDEMVAVAVVLLVLDRTGSAPLAGAVIAAYTLPTVLSGPVLGAWLDRTRRRRAALAGNQLVLGLVMLGLLGALGAAPPAAVLGLAAAVGLTVPMTSGGFTSLLPRFVPAAALPRAHAIEGVTFHVAAILGPASAATLAVLLSPAAAVLAIAGFAALSLLALTGLPAAVNAPVRPEPGSAGGLLKAVGSGLTHLARTPQLRSATAATTVALAGFGMLVVALPLHAEALAGEAAMGGYLLAAVEVGAVVTALAWGRWHGRWRPERVVLATLVAGGATLLGWPLATSFAVLFGLALATGLAQGAGMPALFTTRQRYTPPSRYGQISTTGASLKLGGYAAGAALGGLLVPAWGVTPVLVTVALTQLGAAGLGAALLIPRGPRCRGGRPRPRSPAPAPTGPAAN